LKQLTLHNGDRSFSANLYGNNTGPMVLCLHGFPDNANSFRYQIDDLVAAGYQVLTPTMRGYEPSSITADNNYSIEEIAQDVIAWLDELELQQVHLVGHDWGSAITYAAATAAPERLLSLTTISVPHPKRFSREGMLKVPAQGLKSWYMLFNQIPGVSDYFCQRNDWAFIRFLWRKWSPSYTLSPTEWEDLKATFSKPGVVKAMLSYYRHNVSLPMLLGFKKPALNSVGIIPVPNLAITGADDGCIDTRTFDHCILNEDHPAGMRMERIPQAGHFPHQEKPDEVNQLLINWFKEHDALIQ
jgi:pimeloyl-ACP methyl ester carboxylesterase